MRHPSTAANGPLFAWLAPLHLVLLVLASTGLAACPGPPPPAPPRPAAAAPPATPLPAPRVDGRLPALAVPTQYAIDLDIDPREARFHGRVTISLDVAEPTSFLVLHGRGLEVTTARVESAAGPPIAARVSTRLGAGGKAPEELVLALDRVLPRGTATLTLAYTTSFDEGLAGLYRLHEGDAWYAFTQFEPTDARRAFPCFDEPSFKVPFDVSVTVPSPMIAVANAPEASREELGPKTRFRFNRTPPMPTYLVALAVGELDIKEGTRYSRPPVRIITTKGKTSLNGGKMTTLALEATGGLVDVLATWFALPYPYEKLDIVAVPDFRSGAMENPGLVTFREERLLVDEAHASTTTRRSQALVIAHELAHQWFGDFVTASWWNDLWLNEGMATWMEWRALSAWRPALGDQTDAIISGLEVMSTDGLASARAVRQPVVSTGDAEAAFDGITYQKGAAVLSTIESWLGEEVFQRGVRDYLASNAWKSVQANRLFEALDKASGKNVTQMAASYLDQPGIPEVSGVIECEPGSRWHAELSSQPWRPLGSKIPDDTMRAWTIPVCVRPAGEKRDVCAELNAGAPSLVSGRGCPAFMHPNASAGYYRFSIPERDFVRLAEAKKELDAGGRASLLSNAWAAVRSGALPAAALLRILPAFDDETDRRVIEQLTAVLGAMSDTLVDPESRVAFRTFALGRLAKRKKALGWAPPGTGAPTGDDALTRNAILGALADVAEDDATLREAEDIAVKWLADPASVDPDAGPRALDLASRRAGGPRLRALLAAVRGARSREDRIAALKAMMGFNDDEVLKAALDVTLSDEIRGSEMRYVLAAAFGRRTSRPIAESWVRAHWDALRKKLPGRLGGTLVSAAGVGCTTAEAEERASFYGPRFAEIEGTARSYAGALESVALCAALRDAATPSIRRALLGTKK